MPATLANRDFARSTITGRILSITRDRSTKQGNPMFSIRIDTGTMPLVIRTERNHSIAYAIENPEFRQGFVTFVLNGNSRIIDATPEGD